MNLTEMISLIRQDLHDEDSNNYRWTDNELDRHIIHALSELSESIPQPVRAVIPTTTGSRDLDISALEGRIMVAAVEYPVGNNPPDYQQFSIWGDTLTIISGSKPDGNNCCIYYGVPHVINSEGSTLPEKYTDITAVGACGYAAIAFALHAVNRVNPGGINAPGKLLDWGNQKLEIFRRELKRLGRRNRIRVNELSGAFFTAAHGFKEREY